MTPSMQVLVTEHQPQLTSATHLEQESLTQQSSMQGGLGQPDVDQAVAVAVRKQHLEQGTKSSRAKEGRQYITVESDRKFHACWGVAVKKTLLPSLQTHNAVWITTSGTAK